MKKIILPLLLILTVGMLAAVESEPSAIVGYVKYDCVTGLNFIALPMNTGYTMASDLANAYPGMMDAMNYWDATNQQWIGAYDLGYWEGDFPISSGSVMMINALSASPIYSIGNLPSQNTQYSLILQLNTLMIPLNKSNLTMASELADDIILTGGSLDAMNYWDATNQQWVGAYDLGYWEGDFQVSIGMPLMVNSLATVVWPAGLRKNVQHSLK